MGQEMSDSELKKITIEEFSRIQRYMFSSKENNDMNTYQIMYDRYIELKVILTSSGVNITELDKIKE